MNFKDTFNPFKKNLRAKQMVGVRARRTKKKSSRVSSRQFFPQKVCPQSTYQVVEHGQQFQP